jgi:hypothetical protein
VKNQKQVLLVVGLVLLMAGCKPVLEKHSTPIPYVLDESVLRQTSVSKVTSEAIKTRPPVISIVSPTETSSSLSPVSASTSTTFPDQVLVTPTPELPCNLVQPGIPIDISIPDGTMLLPGQDFTKTWRIINGGSCTWTMQYKYSYYSGNPMGAHQENRLITEVQPGQAVDISVPFVAPFTPGEYVSNWLMQDEVGHYFGMGMNADIPFYVNIRVEAAPTATN